VVDPDGMAIFNGIKDLEKSPPGKSVITNVLSSFSDIGKEIALRAILNDHVRAVRRVHYLDQGNNIWMDTGLMVQLDFPLLELPLPWLQAKLVEGFHGVGNVCLDVHGCVYNSIGSNAENTGQLQPASQDLA